MFVKRWVARASLADGQTYAEAVSKAEEIIDEWIETARKLGRPISEPRGKLAYADRILCSSAALTAAQRFVPSSCCP